jgi:hypothetical protein
LDIKEKISSSETDWDFESSIRLLQVHYAIQLLKAEFPDLKTMKQELDGLREKIILASREKFYYSIGLLRKAEKKLMLQIEKEEESLFDWLIQEFLGCEYLGHLCNTRAFIDNMIREMGLERDDSATKSMYQRAERLDGVIVLMEDFTVLRPSKTELESLSLCLEIKLWKARATRDWDTSKILYGYLKQVIMKLQWETQALGIISRLENASFQNLNDCLATVSSSQVTENAKRASKVAKCADFVRLSFSDANSVASVSITAPSTCVESSTSSLSHQGSR